MLFSHRGDIVCIQNILKLNIHDKSGHEQEKKIQLRHLGFELHPLKIVGIFQS